MSGSEAIQFEQMLQQDPILNSEFGFQQEIVNGLKDFRKAELKMRLNNVDVSPGVFQSVVGNSIVQTTAGVLLTSAVAIGSYWWINTPEQIEPVTFDINSKTSQLDDSEFIDDTIETLPIIKLKSFGSVEDTDRTVKDEEVAVVKKELNIPSVISPKLADDGTQVETTPKVEEFEPVAPDANRDVSQVEVENITNSKNNFHYKFYNNKLFLYGDFSGAPYEILEINNRSGKKLFLFYDSSYYKINNEVTKSTPLEKVTNEDQVSELNILRENKTIE
jgi:hypothetical protein